MKQKKWPIAMSSEPRFRTLKVWESDDHKMIWQLSPAPSNEQKFPKKIYMTLDINQISKGITFSESKPAFKVKPGAMTQIFRKHLNGITLNKIFQDSSSKDYYIILERSSDTASWVLLLTNTKPPELHLINTTEETSYLRWSTRGTYTKRKDFELPPDTFGHKSMQQVGDQLTKHLLDDHPKKDRCTSTEETHENTRIKPTQRTAIQKLRRRLKTLNKSLAKIQSNSTTEQELQSWKQKATLLKQYSYLVKEDSDHITLTPEQTNLAKPLIIEIDSDKSIGENIERYHIKYKKMNTAVLSQKKQRDNCETDIKNTEQDLQYLLSNDLDDKYLEEILTKHKLSIGVSNKKSNTGSPIRQPYKVYTSSDNVKILVGKGATDNDQLTKQAKSNDFWIHAVGVTGSHVIVEGGKFRKDPLPQHTFKEAAILALYFSKLRNDFSGEVYYTRKQHIKKSKGMPPGLWNVEHAPVVFVKFDEKELKNILNRQESV